MRVGRDFLSSGWCLFFPLQPTMEGDPPTFSCHSTLISPGILSVGEPTSRLLDKV